jgi:hypothetical protein
VPRFELLDKLVIRDAKALKNHLYAKQYIIQDNSTDFISSSYVERKLDHFQWYDVFSE